MTGNEMNKQMARLAKIVKDDLNDMIPSLVVKLL
jgi:hypothetical protein